MLVAVASRAVQIWAGLAGGALVFVFFLVQWHEFEIAADNYDEDGWSLFVRLILLRATGLISFGLVYLGVDSWISGL